MKYLSAKPPIIVSTTFAFTPVAPESTPDSTALNTIASGTFTFPVTEDPFGLGSPGMVHVEVDGEPHVLPEADCVAMIASAVKQKLSADPDKPRDLAELANLLRCDNPGKRCVIKLLDYMHANAMATFEELKHHVHDANVLSEDTVEGNIKEARRVIQRYEIPVRLRVSRASLAAKGPVLSRRYMSA